MALSQLYRHHSVASLEHMLRKRADDHVGLGRSTQQLLPHHEYLHAV
jgi:hypothetical protein